MADELRDYRGRITVQTDAALDALSRVSGRDRAEILRDVMHRWALEQIAVASVLDARLRAEGLSGVSEGARGKGPEL